jgi:8-oxo-dGTP diphosphatase
MSDPAPGTPSLTYVVNVEAFVWDGTPAPEGRYLMMVRGASEEIAPGALAPPGGKVEATGGEQDIIEATLRREVLEEVGVEVVDHVYVESHAFEGQFDGRPIVVVDLVFLCRYASGEPQAQDPEEVAGIEWLTPAALRSDPRALPFTLASFDRVEDVRRERGWR